MSPEFCLFTGVLVYFATVAINRFLGERNYGSLAQEDKLKIVDSFSKQRMLGTYVPIGIMLAVIGIIYMIPDAASVCFPIGIFFVLVFSVAIQFSVFRRLNELSLPNDYVTKFRVQSIIVQIGNIIFMSLVALGIILANR